MLWFERPHKKLDSPVVAMVANLTRHNEIPGSVLDMGPPRPITRVITSFDCVKCLPRSTNLATEDTGVLTALGLAASPAGCFYLFTSRLSGAQRR